MFPVYMSDEKILYTFHIERHFALTSLITGMQLRLVCGKPN